MQNAYKDQYLSYLNGGGTTYQSILSPQSKIEEPGNNTFDSMLQTKQDEIILESLKVLIPSSH